MRIKLKQWAEENGVELLLTPEGKIKRDSPQLLEVMQEAIVDGTCPALCDEGCEVEPDGTCSHGAPSLLLAMGVI